MRSTEFQSIEFYYDVVCPYAYLASTQVEAMAQRCGATVQWRPILLGGLLREVGAALDPNQAMSPAKRALLRKERAYWAALYGVPLREPAEHPRRTVDAMRLTLAVEDGPTRAALSKALFEAYWVEGRDVSDPAVLADLAVGHGLAADAFEDPRVRDRLRESTRAAQEAGMFGVPSFVADGRVWWGQDRMPLLERAMGREPPPLHALRDGPRPTRLTIVHDFASPFSYLASTQIERIARSRGVTVEWVPILLGGLFRSLGTPQVPLLEMNAAKRDYTRRDLDDWAQHWGVPFGFPETFPLRSVLPLRVALVEPAATPAIYRAIWVEGASVSEPEGLAPVLTAAGLPAASLLAQAQEIPVKERLRANTEQAQAAGVIGVPTFSIERDGRSILLWGQDRLDMVAAILDGWCPPNVA
ncbi:MAG: 2-hydroxychromene-2-carboxylate isomerase [Myxococcota bacterium]